MIEEGPEAGIEVLVVNGDSTMLRTLVDGLRPEFRVHATGVVDEALAALRDRPIAALLVEFCLPSLPGIALLTRARQIRPGAARFLTGGEVDGEALIQAINEAHIAGFFRRPWDAEQLLARVRAAALSVPAASEDDRGASAPTPGEAGNVAKQDGRIERQRRDTVLFEQEVRESERRLRAMFDNSVCAILLADDAGNYVYASPAARKLLRTSTEELLRRSVFELAAPPQREQARETWRRFIAEGQQSAEFAFTRADGTVVEIEYHAVANVLPGLHASLLHDITDRKRSAGRVREQAVLLDRAHEAIYVRDMDDRIIYWNEGAVRLFGWSRDEALGRISIELLVPPTQRERFVPERWRLLVDGERQIEMEKMARDGRIVTVRSSASVLCDESGHPESVLVIDSDLTEQRRLEAMFLRAQRLESVGRLAGGIAHDLNNVLQPILSSFTLLEGRVPEDARPLVEKIADGARRGAALVSQLLTFARGIEGVRSHVEMRHILSDLRRIVRDTFPKSIQIKVRARGELWPLWGDATQLQQVFTNLAVNALDAMPVGGVLIIQAENVVVDEALARTHPGARPGDYLVVSVIDTGTGIAPQILDKIFDPFFTTKEVGRGTGLGLSTAITVVKGHGGFITAHSELGQGSTFRVYLPAAEGAPAMEEMEEPKAATAPIAESGHGKLVLLVDDEEAVRSTTQALLEMFGYRVITAADGLEALGIYSARADEIAVIATDLMMPKMDGAALIGAARKLHPEVKILATSGFDAGALRAGLLDLPSVKFLAKPYSADNLLSALGELLGK